MQTTKNPKDVSARVLLTPMPKDGVDQFTFMRREGEMSANEVEVLLDFQDSVDPKQLFSCLNKLLGTYLSTGANDFDDGDVSVIENTYQFLLNTWKAETESFEPLHNSFLAG